MPRSATRAIFATLAVAFFAAPIALLAIGVTAERFENRRLASPPALSQGWNAFGQTTRYLTDHMPLRAQAVRANTRIWTDIFNTDPRYGRQTAQTHDEALPFTGTIEQDNGSASADRKDGDLRGPASASTGDDGWLYVPLELRIACDRTVSDDVALKRWSKLVQAVRADGHEAMLFVVPHKASVYPEHLPAKYPYDECALEAKERFWRTLSRDGPAFGVHELRSKLMRLKPEAGDGLFQRKDMHWTTLGALTLVDAVLERLGGGIQLEQQEVVGRGSVPYTGDLSIAGGRPETDRRVEYDIDRAADAPRVPGRTVVICDSFGYKWIRLFKPYFDSVRYVSWYHGPEKVVEAVRQADTVIVEADEILFRAQAPARESVVSITRMLEAGN